MRALLILGLLFGLSFGGSTHIGCQSVNAEYSFHNNEVQSTKYDILSATVEADGYGQLVLMLHRVGHPPKKYVARSANLEDGNMYLMIGVTDNVQIRGTSFGFHLIPQSSKEYLDITFKCEEL